MTGDSVGKGEKSGRSEDRHAREAEALRENLKRRKAQQRGRETPQDAVNSEPAQDKPAKIVPG